ncbi:hypothetical protein LPB72_09490 [Hydrogenophaga crassostreae]|uniref:Lcl C-terminal domain-containing protein n=1 Tax=Hydrogenophaga crassostreae TaxID=1763535 RepID=A0A162T0K8_9BURK|nr:DUF1566 domain-containing protein [Hydrogenophaga crassostreae]AOW13282.1 hypothetical protein LPB072_10885 [Hydrogenophaga crassostreae]OAD42104.1 hypothetical protein LPB72_09490 [Hydrogenophaga crassostreae]
MTYTNYGDGTSGDASEYVTRINQLALCGYTDWRLPTRQELMNIFDFGRITSPGIDTTWFLNTAAADHWTGDLDKRHSASAWDVNFEFGWSTSRAQTARKAVRLVRGSSTNGPRFTYSTVAYLDDGANNVVNDIWTGLQWRRCEQGRVWTGSVCTGAPISMDLDEALNHARAQSGWRLPNFKELVSLVDLSVSTGASIDAGAFPGARTDVVWSSTPYLGNVRTSRGISFFDGAVRAYPRSFDTSVRLVRSSP